MSHPCRLSLRAPPHLPFIQGWPGIPGSPERASPAIHGVVEVRIGLNPIKAKWVRVEIRKHEVLPAGFPPQQGETWEHVGQIVALWQPPAGKEWADLESADYKFSLPLPDDMPPSVDVMKGGIRYELVAALCYKNRDGMFKKGATGIAKVSEHIRITKHELHSAWPVYQKPDARTVQDPKSSTSLTVQRPGTAFGPADKILLTATLRSNRTQAFKLKGFDCHLHEILTALPSATADKKRKSTQPMVKSRIVASTRIAIGEMVAMGGEKSARIEMGVPKDKLLVTVRNAKALNVAYEVEVKAVCDTLPPLSMMGIRYTVGTLSRGLAVQAINEIGYVELLCPGQPPPIQTNGTASPGVPPMDVVPRPLSYPGPQGSPSPSLIPGPPPGPMASPSLIPGPPPVHVIHAPPNTQPTPRGFELRDRAAQIPPAMMFPTPNAPQRAPSTATMTTMTSTSDRAHSPEANDYSQNRFSSATFGPGSRDGVIPARTPPTAWQPDPMLNRMAGLAVDGKARPQSMQTPRTQAQYMSAVEEKNQQRKKYEAADRRVVSEPMKAGPAATPPAAQMPDEPPIPYDQIDLSEKEQLRRYREAKEKAETAHARPQEVSPSGVLAAAATVAAASEAVVNSGPTPSPSISSATSPPPAPGPSTFLSAAQEKDMMRKRYEEAQNKVARAQGGSGSANSPPVASSSTVPAAISTATSSANTPPTPSTSTTVPNPVSPPLGGPATFMSAAEEKDMMRKRYEEAAQKVARAQGGPGFNSAANSPPVASSSTIPAATPPLASSSTTPAAAPPPIAAAAGYMSAAEEKDMMRRRYEEATKRVASGSGAGAGASSPTPEQPPAFGAAGSSASGSGGAAGPSGSSTSQFMSAAEEKDMMRRRYEEATKRVAGASGSPPPEQPPSFAAGPSGSSGSSGPSGPTHYMSAAEEKDQMRRRYEEATRRVAGGSGSPPPEQPPAFAPVAGPSGGGSGSGSGPSGSTRYMSPAEEKDLMRKRYEEAAAKVASNASSPAIPTSPIVPIPVEYFDAPPPPLPARPPADYINLLSPALEKENGFDLK